MKKLIAVFALLSSLAAFSDYLFWNASGYSDSPADGTKAWLVGTGTAAYDSSATKLATASAYDGAFGNVATTLSDTPSAYYYILIGSMTGDSVTAIAYSSIVAYNELSAYVYSDSASFGGLPVGSAWKPTSYTAIAIPEPTSALLLLLGVSGLALRRRRV